MAQFSDIGAACSHQSCCQQDFLPLTCDGCKKQFCSAHFSSGVHACQGAAAKDRRVLICSICKRSVPHPAGEDGASVLSRHCMSDECRPRVETAKCPVLGCRENLTTINTYTCPVCSKRVCMMHRHQEAHRCVTSTQSFVHRRSKPEKSILARRRSKKQSNGVMALLRRLFCVGLTPTKA